MANTGFKDALDLMQMGSGADGDDDEQVSITPAPKRPRLSNEIAEGLRITPPPVVGKQSDSWFNLVSENGYQSGGPCIELWSTMLLQLYPPKFPGLKLATRESSNPQYSVLAIRGFQFVLGMSKISLSSS